MKLLFFSLCDSFVSLEMRKVEWREISFLRDKRGVEEERGEEVLGCSKENGDRRKIEGE